MASRPHPEQGFRSALGVMRLAKKYSPERVEAACERALALRPSPTSRSSRCSHTDSTNDHCARRHLGPRRAPQHPWSELLPMRENPVLTHTTIEGLKSLGCRPWPRASPNNESTPTTRASVSKSGSDCWSTRSSCSARTAGSHGS